MPVSPGRRPPIAAVEPPPLSASAAEANADPSPAEPRVAALGAARGTARGTARAAARGDVVGAARGGVAGTPRGDAVGTAVGRGGGRRRGAATGRGGSASELPPARRNTTPGLRMRRFGNLSVLLPPAAPPAQSLAGCLEKLRQDWQQEGHEAALWQAWPTLAGPQLAPHCRPLQLRGGVLSVGAAPGPWLQALQYNRHQLLGALRAAGFRIREIRVQQHHPGPAAAASSADAATSWACHPSRIDVHGLADCPQCRRPAPAGEMARWGHCGFCRRAALAAQGPPPAAEPPRPEGGPAAGWLIPRD
jgi:predicted nucleic acid-binding Zn ribbon protein